MNPPFRLVPGALLLVWCAGVWTGCASETVSPPDAPPDTPAVAEVCQVDQDCPDPGLFFCDTVTSRCQAACRTEVDCTGQKRGRYRLAECEDNPLGCRCEASRCVQALCSSDGECAAGGRVCRAVRMPASTSYQAPAARTASGGRCGRVRDARRRCKGSAGRSVGVRGAARRISGARHPAGRMARVRRWSLVDPGAPDPVVGVGRDRPGAGDQASPQTSSTRRTAGRRLMRSRWAASGAGSGMSCCGAQRST